MNKFEWKLTRHLVDKPNAQQRWDQIYQLLLDWSKPSASSNSPPAAALSQIVEIDKSHSQEVPINESGSLCEGLKPSSGSNPNH